MPAGRVACARSWAALVVVVGAAAGDAAWPSSARVCSRAAPGVAKSDPWTDLCTWAEDSCGLPVVGRYFEGEFDKGGVRVTGIGSAQAFREGQEMGCISGTCLLQTRDAAWPSALSELEEEDDDGSDVCEDDHELLAIYLAEEEVKGSSSRIWPWIRALPSESHYRLHHPAYLEDVLATVQDEGQAEEMQMRWPEWRRSFSKCVAAYGAKSGRSLNERDAFRNFVHVSARHFEKFGQFFMVPFIDKMNTGLEDDLNVEVSYHRDENNHLADVCMVARKYIAIGDELLVDYESWNSPVTEFFETFGFTLATDHHPEIEAGECKLLTAHAAMEPANATPSLHALKRLSQDLCT